jgi:phospholipase C
VVFIEQAAKLQLNEHPSNGHGIQPGAADTKKIIDALMDSTAWKSSVVILLYDEAGGLYDHVPPVPLPKPDDIAPMFEGDDLRGKGDKQYDFDESGFRIPMIVVSPWVKKNFVSHVPRDFTSILKLIETRFDLPPLTRRDAEADNMLEFFDFTSPAWLTPPPLPRQPWYSTLPALNPEQKSKAEFDPEAGDCRVNQGIDPAHLANPFAR